MISYLLLAIAAIVLVFEISFWGIRLRDLILSLWWVPRAETDERHPLEDAPLISVIVPAHNEERTIRECLNSVLNQDYPNFELILVDDRSDDLTASIAQELGRGRPNFKIVSVQHLPFGWTGKCHALDVGVRHAEGKWLAFLDADSCLHRAALRECYRLATDNGVNMVTLSPGFVLKTFWEKALQPTFAAMSCILFPLAKVNDPSSPVASANGMFYLINRKAYEEIGGHEEVRGLAVEDIGIGKRIKAAGLGLLFADGRHILKTRMYTNFLEIIRGWTRILSASMNYEIQTVLKYLAMHIMVSLPMMILGFCLFFPAVGEFLPHGFLVLPVILLVQMSVASSWFCSKLGVPKSYSALMTIGNLMLIWVHIIIAKKILMKDALQWRGTTYQHNLYEPTQLDPEAGSGVYPAHSSTALEKLN